MKVQSLVYLNVLTGCLQIPAKIGLQQTQIDFLPHWHLSNWYWSSLELNELPIQVAWGERYLYPQLSSLKESARPGESLGECDTWLPMGRLSPLWSNVSYIRASPMYWEFFESPRPDWTLDPDQCLPATLHTVFAYSREALNERSSIQFYAGPDWACIPAQTYLCNYSLLVVSELVQLVGAILGCLFLLMYDIIIMTRSLDPRRSLPTFQWTWRLSFLMAGTVAGSLLWYIFMWGVRSICPVNSFSHGGFGLLVLFWVGLIVSWYVESTAVLPVMTLIVSALLILARMPFTPRRPVWILWLLFQVYVTARTLLYTYYSLKKESALPQWPWAGTILFHLFIILMGIYPWTIRWMEHWPYFVSVPLVYIWVCILPASLFLLYRIR
jgi:hypothetical protein